MNLCCTKAAQYDVQHLQSLPYIRTDNHWCCAGASAFMTPAIPDAHPDAEAPQLITSLPVERPAQVLIPLHIAPTRQPAIEPIPASLALRHPETVAASQPYTPVTPSWLPAEGMLEQRAPKPAAFSLSVVPAYSASKAVKAHLPDSVSLLSYAPCPTSLRPIASQPDAPFQPGQRPLSSMPSASLSMLPVSTPAIDSPSPSFSMTLPATSHPDQSQSHLPLGIPAGEVLLTGNISASESCPCCSF